MRTFCTLILGGTLLPAQAQALATALCARRPYHLHGSLTPEKVLERMAEERAPIFEFDGVEDGALFPEVARIMEEARMEWAWFTSDNNQDNGAEDRAYLRAADGSTASFPTLSGGYDLALQVRGATPDMLEEAVAWQRWFDGLRLDLAPSAHAALDHHAAHLRAQHA